MYARRIGGVLLALAATVALLWALSAFGGTPNPYWALGAFVVGGVAFGVCLKWFPGWLAIAGFVGGLVASLLGGMRNDGTYALISMGYAFAVFIVAVIAHDRRKKAIKVAREWRIMAHGLVAEGAIVEVRRTLVSSEDVGPVVKFVIEYRRFDGNQVRARHKQVVPYDNVPNVGDVVLVRYEPTGTQALFDIPDTLGPRTAAGA
jgi:hypothetical protein